MLKSWFCATGKLLWMSLEEAGLLGGIGSFRVCLERENGDYSLSFLSLPFLLVVRCTYSSVVAALTQDRNLETISKGSSSFNFFA